MTIGWRFDNTYSKLPDPFISNISPIPVKSPELIILNDNLSKQLGLNFSLISKKELSNLFSGNSLPEGSKSIAQAYAGHQFGHFTMLGDGRAVLMGEHISKNNERFDIQFKGSGQTPFSRNGDGRAALGPMLREYIISEAMHSLNIPTTRSMAVVKTGEDVIRENILQGAILTRVASSHLRVGTFQYVAMRNNESELRTLVDYTINRHYPNIKKSKNKALDLLKVLIELQIDLVVNWMRVGFIHGVMNTDNMALSGETIDYGPCAFLDEYNPKKVFSSIDQNGRYAFNNQPKIALWNLARFAETILHLIDKDQSLAIKKIENVLKSFEKKYHERWLEMMKNKLQINNHSENDGKLITELLDLMHVFKLDFTNTFIEIDNDQIRKYDFMKKWISKLEDRKKINKEFEKLNYNYNPRIIPRNHLVEKVLNESENGNYSLLIKFIENLNDPYSNDISSDFQRGPTEDEKVHQTFCGT